MKFKNSKKGDLVWDILVGPGKISYIDENGLTVEFENVMYRYDLEGKVNGDGCNSTLFKYEEKNIIFERPEFKIKHKKRYIIVFLKNGKIFIEDVDIDSKVDKKYLTYLYHKYYTFKSKCCNAFLDKDKITENDILKYIDETIEYEKEI